MATTKTAMEIADIKKSRNIKQFRFRADTLMFNSNTIADSSITGVGYLHDCSIKARMGSTSLCG
ncbi:MAG: hypothetical protein LBI39_03825 [Puniceicoccales bacterium]|nr:hypothetical protein [Puniceicoccales bacterium]